MRVSRTRMAYRRARMVYRRIQAAIYMKFLSSSRGALLDNEQGPLKPGYLIAIYRARNADLVERIVHDAESAGLRIGLWALDSCVPTLTRVTLGVGPGSRTELLTQLDQKMRESADEFVLLADDDFEFIRGAIAPFIRISARCGFMLSQPSHIPSSNCSYSFTHCRPWLIARSTTFVEPGPIVLIHPDFYSRVFPMPTNFGMGWGLELLWLKCLAPKERFGIVDSVCISHHGVVGKDYQSLDSEVNQLQSLLRQMNISNIRKIFKTTSVWRKNSPMPKHWVSDPGGSG
jgi:hypothetical protein